MLKYSQIRRLLLDEPELIRAILNRDELLLINCVCLKRMSIERASEEIPCSSRTAARMMSKVRKKLHRFV